MELTAKNFDEKVLGSEDPVLVMFWGSWCPVCKRSEEMLDELDRDLGNRVKVGKLNIDRNRVIASRYKVAGTPAYYLFKDGEVLGMKVGSMTKGGLKDFIKGRLDGQ